MKLFLQGFLVFVLCFSGSTRAQIASADSTVQVQNPDSITSKKPAIKTDSVRRPSSKPKLFLKDKKTRLTQVEKTNLGKQLLLEEKKARAALRKDNLKLAALAFAKASEISQQLKDTSHLIRNLEASSEILEKQNQYSEAAIPLFQLLHLYEGNNDEYNTAYTLFVLSRLHQKKNEKRVSLEFGLRSFGLAYKLQNDSLIFETSKLVASNYQKIGDFNRALKFSDIILQSYGRIAAKDQERNIQALLTNERSKQASLESELFKIRDQRKSILQYSSLLLVAALLLLVLHQTHKIKLRAGWVKAIMLFFILFLLQFIYVFINPFEMNSLDSFMIMVSINLVLVTILMQGTGVIEKFSKKELF